MPNDASSPDASAETAGENTPGENGDLDELQSLHEAGEIGHHRFAAQIHGDQNELYATVVNRPRGEAGTNHKIYKKEGKNRLHAQLANKTRQTVTFHAGRPPDNPNDGGSASGLYLHFEEMSASDLKRFAVDDDPWTSRIASTEGPGGRPQHWLVLYVPDGKGDQTLKSGDALEIPLTVKNPQDLAKTQDTLTLRYPRLTASGGKSLSDLNQIHYSVVSVQQTIPSNLAIKFSGEDKVQIESESRQGGNVPPNELRLLLRNASSSKPLLEDGWSERPTFTFVPSTATKGHPASTVLLRRQQAGDLEVSAANDVAKKKWTLDEDGIRFQLRPTQDNKNVLAAGESAKFTISGLKTDLKPGWANAFLFVPDLPGYSAYTDVLSAKKIHAKPTVRTFDAEKDEVYFNQPDTLTWETYGYNSATRLKVPSLGIDEAVDVSGSKTIRPQKRTTHCTLIRKWDGEGGRHPLPDQKRIKVTVDRSSVKNLQGVTYFDADGNLKRWAPAKGTKTLAQVEDGYESVDVSCYQDYAYWLAINKKSGFHGPVYDLNVGRVDEQGKSVEYVKHEQRFSDYSFKPESLCCAEGKKNGPHGKTVPMAYVAGRAKTGEIKVRYRMITGFGIPSGWPRASLFQDDNRYGGFERKEWKKRQKQGPLTLVHDGQPALLSYEPSVQGPFQARHSSVRGVEIEIDHQDGFCLHDGNVKAYAAFRPSKTKEAVYVDGNAWLCHATLSSGPPDVQKLAKVENCDGLGVEPRTGDPLWVDVRDGTPVLRRYILEEGTAVDLASLDDYSTGIAIIPEHVPH